jgi:PAS domain S-box-containing protein
MNADSNESRVNILMVDDQPAKLLSYEAILSKLGENLIKAGSAREALDLLLKFDVAVVLLDVSMPILNGFELAAMIRQHPRFETTALIFISAVQLTDLDRLRGYESGAVDYIPVPIVPELLRAKVRVFVDLFRKTRQLERLNSELERRVAQRTAELEASTARLAESEDRFRLASDAAGAMVYDIDLRGNRPAAVHGIERIVGVGSERIPETDDWWTLRIHPDDLLEYRARLELCLTAGGAFSSEYRIRRIDGSWIDVADTAQVIHDDRGIAVRVVGAVVDITERRHAAAAMQRLLEQETAARAEAETARIEAQASNRAKDEFLALVSHELRSPLNAILGWNAILKRQPDAATQQRAAATIERNGQQQLRLIEDLMDTARIIGGKVKLTVQHLELGGVLMSAFDAVRTAAQAKRITLVPELSFDPVPILGDPDRIQQILWNLLSNAIKFTPEGGLVTVKLYRDAARACLVVSDTGIGIDPSFLPYVFDRFRQADSSASRRTGGLGLGLALVHHLVEMHGGTVEAHSDGRNQGATFTLRLPISSVRLIETGNDAGRIVGDDVLLPAVRVLVVDDDADARDFVATALGLRGATVETVDSAQNALHALAAQPAEEPFDVLVCDIAMPEMDGYTLIRHIRAMENGFGSIPAIALTAFAGDEDCAMALESGFQRHVTKPVDPGELARIIGQLLGSRRRAAPSS